MAQAIGLPTIVSPYKEQFPGFPNIIPNDVAIGKMAAEHLLDRGFQRFAYCGFYGISWSEERGAGFAKRTAVAGFETHFYMPPRSRIKRLWENEQVIMADWLKSLPKPVGVMTCNDDHGQQVLEACKIAGLNVPGKLL